MPSVFFGVNVRELPVGGSVGLRLAGGVLLGCERPIQLRPFELDTFFYHYVAFEESSANIPSSFVELSLSVLHSIPPASSVPTAVAPLHLALAVLQVIEVLP